MSRPGYRRRQPPPKDERYWQQIVENRLPLVGGWFREVAVNRLAQSARQGVPTAAASLANALDANEDEDVREISRQTLMEINGTAAMNAVWAVWAASRPTRLQELLVSRARPATAPFSLRLLSLLLLELQEKAEPVEPDELPELLRACQDRDPEIAGRAQGMLLGLSDQETIDAFCAAWLTQRLPWMDAAILEAEYTSGQTLLQVMVTLKRGQLEDVVDAGAEVVGPLLRAGRDRDGQISRRAAACLARLTDLDARDELCRIWSQTREQLAEKVIRETGWVARQPAEARLLSALLNERLDLASQAAPEEVPILLSANRDKNSRLAGLARTALAELSRVDSQHALCQAFIEQGDPIAAAVSVRCGYMPDMVEQRALFALLSGQWEVYASIDFDQRILQSIFAAGSAELRQRISQSIQRSGRADFLGILTGGLTRSQAANLTVQETDLYLRLLAENQQWQRLWEFAVELPVEQLLYAVDILHHSAWQPPAEDIALFSTLTRSIEKLHAESLPTSQPDVPAVRAASIRVRGRVNALAFAPDRPVLAIGTGQRVVVLFDYSLGQVVKMITGFDHSIARVAFSPSGRLFCAERANPDTPCGIYEITDRPLRIGQAGASVLALKPAPDDRLVTLSNDRQLTLWDTHTGASAGNPQQFNLPLAAGLPRELLLSPENNRLALLYRHISFLNYPTFDGYSEFYRTFNRSTQLSKSVARCGAWLDDGSRLVVGQANGQVVEYRMAPGKSYREKRGLYYHDRSAVAVKWLVNRKELVSAGGEGDICFFPEPDWQPVQTISCPCERLTALEVAPNEELMAVGTSDNRLLLWDLRANQLPALLQQPIGIQNLPDLELAASLLAADGLQPAQRSLLESVLAALAFRFRYEIQVDPQPMIRPGEFDILLAEADSESK